MIDDKGEMYIPYTGCTRETNDLKSFVVKYNIFHNKYTIMKYIVCHLYFEDDILKVTTISAYKSFTYIYHNVA